MEKTIIIKGDQREVDKVIQENGIRVKMGLISIECSNQLPENPEPLDPGPENPEKGIGPLKNEKKEPVKDTKKI